MFDGEYRILWLLNDKCACRLILLSMLLVVELLLQHSRGSWDASLVMCGKVFGSGLIYAYEWYFSTRCSYFYLVQNAREFEIGILGNRRVNLVGEIIYDVEFYDYETKLTDETTKLHISINIPSILSKTS